MNSSISSSHFEASGSEHSEPLPPDAKVGFFDLWVIITNGLQLSNHNETFLEVEEHHTPEL